MAEDFMVSRDAVITRQKISYMVLAVQKTDAGTFFSLYIDGFRMFKFETKPWTLGEEFYVILGQANLEYIDHVAVYPNLLNHQDLFENSGSVGKSLLFQYL